MKCPHCQHTADQSQQLRCTQCGQVYERAHFDEFQNLFFLQDWLQQHKNDLGNQAETLLAEVESRQMEVRQLLGIQVRPVEQVARELALMQGTLTCIRDWCKVSMIKNEATNEFIQHLKLRNQYLNKFVGGLIFDHTYFAPVPDTRKCALHQG